MKKMLSRATGAVPSLSSIFPVTPRTIFWACVVLAGAIGLLVYSYLSRPSAQVYRASHGTAVSAVYGTVRIEWTYTVPIRAQNNGYLQLAPDIFEGTSSIGIRVHKDQLLGTILDEETSRQFNQAKINLDAATAREKVGPPSMGAYQSAVDTQNRVENLYKVGGVSDAQLQQARNDAKRLSDAVQAEQIEIQRNVDTCTQELKSLGTRMGRTEIKAPIDGILTAINNNNNELVSQNTTVFTVAKGETYVSGQVNEEDIGSIREKLKAKVRLYSFPETEFIATVSSILPYPDPTTQRYTVTLKLDKPPDNLMAGMTGEMNIIIGERQDALLIPKRALLTDSKGSMGGNKVFVVDGGVVKPRLVKVGYQSMQIVEIVEGLRLGERVVVEDQDLFEPGERVRAIEINPAAAAPSP